MPNAEEWKKMREIDIHTVAKDDLIDLNTVQIDESQPREKRIEQFVQQIKNPYCYRVGDVMVKVSYQKQGPTFQQNFEDMLASM